MASLPARYLYLIEEDTGEAVAAFPADHFTRELDLISFEARLRAVHAVDDPASGLALKDSAIAPLPVPILRKAMAAARKTGAAMLLIWFWAEVGWNCLQAVGLA